MFRTTRDDKQDAQKEFAISFNNGPSSYKVRLCFRGTINNCKQPLAAQERELCKECRLPARKGQCAAGVVVVKSRDCDPGDLPHNHNHTIGYSYVAVAMKSTIAA